MDLETQLAQERERWEAAGLKRELVRQSSSDAQLGSPNRAGDFCSNDFLGLSSHGRLIDAARQAITEFGTGARAARLLGGGGGQELALEQEVADWQDCQAALLFPSGYQANLGLITGLADRRDALFSDALNHASIIDAIKLARSQRFVFRHNDVDHLGRLLASPAAQKARRRLVSTETIFSMDGDRAPLEELNQLCERYDAWLLLDEAHATGLLGERGQGLCEPSLYKSELSRVLARTITGGKALGVAGALVCASTNVQAYLVSKARSFVFSTSPPPATVAALRAAVAVVNSNEGRKLRECALGHTRQTAQALALEAPAAAILPFIVGPNEQALGLAESLQAKGLDARAVRPPTVPENTARLRLVFHAHNDDKSVSELTAGLQAAQASITTAPDTGSSTPAASRHDLNSTLFVTGTDTGIGKTMVSALCMRYLQRTATTEANGSYWKPVQTGDESDTEEVRRLALPQPTGGAPATSRAHIEFHEPSFHFALPASPHEAAAAENRAVDLEALKSALHSKAQAATERGQKLVAELAGGLLVPLTNEVTQLDWLAEARPPLILVARSGLGTLNHTLLSLRALRSVDLEPRALFLVGEPHDSNRNTLGHLGQVQLIFEVPHFPSVDTATLDKWLDSNDLKEVFANRAE